MFSTTVLSVVAGSPLSSLGSPVNVSDPQSTTPFVEGDSKLCVNGVVSSIFVFDAFAIRGSNKLLPIVLHSVSGVPQGGGSLSEGISILGHSPTSKFDLTQSENVHGICWMV